jgi:hypothetical protein
MSSLQGRRGVPLFFDAGAASALLAQRLDLCGACR